jgi:hypothetical protein
MTLEESTLADRYIMSVAVGEEKPIQMRKYFQYYDYVVTLDEADGTLFDLVNRIKEDKK